MDCPEVECSRLPFKPLQGALGGNPNPSSPVAKDFTVGGRRGQRVPYDFYNSAVRGNPSNAKIAQAGKETSVLQRQDAIEAIPRDLMFYRRHAAQVTRNLPELREEWNRLLEKMRALAPREVAEVETRACSNINRYFARLAYEGAAYGNALVLLRDGFRSAPAAFIGDARNWLTLGACLTGLLLPAPVHHGLERMAGLRRGRR